MLFPLLPSSRGRWSTVTTSTGHDEHTLRMRAALTPVLALGPEFLAGRRDADAMAETMVRAVQEYLEGELAHRPAGDAAPASVTREARQLEGALAEIHTCGSGYLAQRCDSDCVARTIGRLLDEFGDPAPGDPHG